MKKCKKCSIEKELSEYYTHPQTRDGHLGTCKECIKAERRSDHGREMARIQDKKRMQNPKRKEYNKVRFENFKINNPEKRNAQVIIGNIKRKKCNQHLLTNTCIVCGEIGMIHYHHFDYSKPNEVIPCCPRCHSKFHRGVISIRDNYKLFFL